MATVADRNHPSYLASVQPTSPSTPQKPLTFASVFSSPAANYRPEEEVVIFGLGSRYLRAGFAGDSAPRCTLPFGPRRSRRVGDYRDWLPGNKSTERKKENSKLWGSQHILWRMDLREMDLGLVEDRIERGIREAYGKHLLLDSKSRRVMLVLPSVVPHPLLTIIFTCLFTNFQVPGITLLSEPVLSVVGAGLRSGMVVDIGWHETTITAVYEYREIFQSRTTRAMRMVSQEMAAVLQRLSSEPASDQDTVVDFEHTEEVVTRMGWCQLTLNDEEAYDDDIEAHLSNFHVSGNRGDENQYIINEDTTVALPLFSSSSKETQVPFSTFRQPIESALFATTSPSLDFDDEEQPLHRLLYKALLSIPPDVRGICMARIIVTGGGSNIPGLKTRLINELSAIYRARGWDPVCGKAAENYRKTQEEISNIRRANPLIPRPVIQRATSTGRISSNIISSISPAHEAPIPDPIEEQLRREAAKDSKPVVSGIIRGVESLGSFAGASLVAALRIKGIVEIERDVFLQHGMAGARKETEISLVPNRQTFRPGLGHTGVSERAGWTLGAWA